MRRRSEAEIGRYLPTVQAPLQCSGPKWNLQSLVNRVLLLSGSGGPSLPLPPQRAPERAMLG